MSSLGSEIMTGQAAIYYGQATTASSYIFPSATVEAWDAYIATATAIGAGMATDRAGSIVSMHSQSVASRLIRGFMISLGPALMIISEMVS